MPLHQLRNPGKNQQLPRADVRVNPQIVPSSSQVQAILAQVENIRPELAAFFGCLYYAALRPEEAVALRAGDVVLPPRGWGELILISACPRTGAAWTSTGSTHELRGLKHRPSSAIRIVPIPPVLATLLRQHLHRHGTAPDGRVFRGTRGGPLSESLYGRVWHTARKVALGPAPATTTLARRPYDLRHAALSLWLNASAAPAQIAARAGNSVPVLQTIYTHCIDGQDDLVNQQIEHALGATAPSLPVTASGSPDRRHRSGPVRHMSVNGPRRAARHQPHNTSTRAHIPLHDGHLYRSEEESAEQARVPSLQ